MATASVAAADRLRAPKRSGVGVKPEVADPGGQDLLISLRLPSSFNRRLCAAKLSGREGVAPSGSVQVVALRWAPHGRSTGGFQWFLLPRDHSLFNWSKKSNACLVEAQGGGGGEGKTPLI